jgi:hypothetical protein
MTLVRTTCRDQLMCKRHMVLGEIQPVEVTIPSLAEEDDDVSGMANGIDAAMDIDETPEESSVRKGKRKAVD